MGARADAARAEVVARRELLAEEVVRLEAAGRAAIDIPAKVRRAPAKTAGLAAGTAFVALGGPRRLYRRARRAVLGPRAELPKSMLPKEIDRRLRALGDDGEKVRGALEREFASYLEKHREERESRDLGATVAALAGNILRPVTARAGRRMAEQLLDPDSTAFQDAMARIRARRADQTGSQTRPPAGQPTPPAQPSTGRPGAPR